VPLRHADPARSAAQDCPVLQHPAGTGDRGADVPTIYQVPISYSEQGFDEQVLAYFGIQAPPPDLKSWRSIVDRGPIGRRGHHRRCRQVHFAARQL